MFSRCRRAVIAIPLLAGYAQAAHAAGPTKNIYSLPAKDYGESSDLVADSSGDLYGITSYGGLKTGNCQNEGCGTVYKLAPPSIKGERWPAQVLYEFTDSTDGYYPSGKALIDSSGNIYGTSVQGGIVGSQAGGGTVWKLSPPSGGGGSWKLQVLYTFIPNAPGSNPGEGLVEDNSGILYGSGDGAVFSLAPPGVGGTAWTEAILHVFNPQYDLGGPGQLLLSRDQKTLTAPATGSKTAPFGGIFRLRRTGSSWTYAILARYTTFPGQGVDPIGGLIADRDGNLFGTASDGGASLYGTVFELSPPAPGKSAWTQTVLHAFDDADGSRPVGGLVEGGKPVALFGTTQSGGYGGAVDGSTGNQGVTFRLNPPASGSGPWTYTELHAFSTNTCKNGGAGNIQNGLTFGHSRQLYGVASEGGLHKRGAVFIQPPY